MSTLTLPIVDLPVVGAPKGGQRLYQPPLPDWYRNATDEELAERIETARAALGDRVVILCHHYQQDSIFRYADFTGDSFKLARLAQQRPEAKYIIFCGVHFMAESADVLSQPDQVVILPNLTAGCSMADMANIDQVEQCWEELQEAGCDSVIPITYMNSAADLKAFVGRNGGAVCTSSNAARILEWAFERGRQVLFFPDQHLGRNTGKAMGVPLDEMVVWDPEEDFGGNDPASLNEKKIILWKGHCSVHGRFSVEQIQQARREYPGIQVIVHPECPMDVVDAADQSGSTEYILQAVNRGKPGDRFAIGTEINMVNRLAENHPEMTIFCLDPVVCPCSTMYRIHPSYLAWTLDNLREGRVVNPIVVPQDIAAAARTALDRMLANG
ncbi:MAG TPA: quinolinate synthase NadA, partial [Armatimonadota bacterium]|nr:quinolinate synthase NadA [Armatimonadota bacterium]